MSTIPRPYEKTTIRGGHTLDELTNYALYATEAELGYTRGSLTVVQGSYNAGGVAQSAGTHDGGGAVDLTAAAWEKKVHALRKVGFAAWHRPFNWDGRGGGEHIHCILIGNARLSLSAVGQVEQYRVHTNGLANHAPDPTWHPDPIPTFVMPALPVPKRRVFHVHGKPYRTEDSLRGVKTARNGRYKWIDLDCHVTKDGVLVITHWPRPDHEGFHDPAGKVDVSGKMIEQLTWAEVRVLTTKDHYHIWKADDLVPIALAKGLNVELEMKSTKIKRSQLGALRDILSDQSRVQVKALPQFYTALEGAYAAGYKTIILGRNARIPANAQPYITYRRGRVNWS
jgi:hypothetical protein